MAGPNARTKVVVAKIQCCKAEFQLRAGDAGNNGGTANGKLCVVLLQYFHVLELSVI